MKWQDMRDFNVPWNYESQHFCFTLVLQRNLSFRRRRFETLGILNILDFSLSQMSSPEIKYNRIKVAPRASNVILHASCYLSRNFHVISSEVDGTCRTEKMQSEGRSGHRAKVDPSEVKSLNKHTRLYCYTSLLRNVPLRFTHTHTQHNFILLT